MGPRDYKANTKYRVVKEGGSLDGMVPMGISNALSGKRVSLDVGDIILCHGSRWGWGSDPGREVQFSAAPATDGMSFVTFSPAEWGAMSQWPKDGYLEEVVED